MSIVTDVLTLGQLIEKCGFKVDDFDNWQLDALNDARAYLKSNLTMKNIKYLINPDYSTRRIKIIRRALKGDVSEDELDLLCDTTINDNYLGDIHWAFYKGLNYTTIHNLLKQDLDPYEFHERLKGCIDYINRY